HWVFLINLPLGLIALVYAQRVLAADKPVPSEKLDVVGVLLMSPGLAALLYGVSSIPGEGTVQSATVIIPSVIGVLLIVAFVFHALAKTNPLLDLRLLADRNLAVSLIVMFLFAAAFFGALLLVPTYFQQVRGESVLKAGLLIAPQGLGAMLTMPIAGTLTDKMPVGRIVPFGFVGILVGLFGLSQSTDPSTPYWHIIGWLFIMGLGMGSTMMPIFTSALKTLKSHEVARGSTLLNVVQQVASATGIAIMTVILTNHFKDSAAVSAAQAIEAAKDRGIPAPAGALEIMQGLGDRFQSTVLSDMADGFGSTYLVALAMLVVALVPVYFLPRKREESHLLDDQDGNAAPIIMH
ncbi:MAG: DHA2 family efflux MFS transporter permease subunit, partial [Actinomycetales bacterium]